MSRLHLQTVLEELIGNRNVYFQSPASIKMKYPAIVYTLQEIRNQNADNGVYNHQKQYMVTLIDANPDSTLVDKLASLPTSRFSRHYKIENLNHWVFSLFDLSRRNEQYV